MKTIYELQLNADGEDRIVSFGIPDKLYEIEKMHRLRYEVYSNRGYIDANLFPDEIEKDEYDKENKSTYFIAKIDGRVIGTVRLIKDHYLPTEKECFRFKEPDGMCAIPRENRAELGRLIVIKYSDKKYLPRNIVMLFLINSLVTYGMENNILGGYAFIKDNLRLKLEKLKMPIHLIENYEQVYPIEGVLCGYFNQQDNKVIPMYFITQDFKKYIDKIINNSLIFKKIDDKKYILRENLYNKILKFLKVI